jgi:hypothetical protein
MFRSILLAVLLFQFQLWCVGQQRSSKTSGPMLFPFSDPAKGNKWGFVDGAGHTVIAAKYRMADQFEEGRALVWGERNGYIDERDHLVMELPHDCTVAFRVQGGAAWFRSDDNGKYGCLDRDGKLIVRPKYDRAGNFCEGLARVNLGARHIRVGFEGGKWGYVDSTGCEVIALQFDEADDFSGGVARVAVQNRVSFIDRDGRHASKPAIISKRTEKQSFPPKVIRTSEGRVVEANVRHAYRGELARVHIGGTLSIPLDGLPEWNGGAWFYVNRDGRIVCRMANDDGLAFPGPKTGSDSKN